MNNRFFFMMSRLSAALKIRMKRAFRQSGITVSNAQIGLLFALEKGDRLTMSGLSEILKTDNGATFRLVEHLAKSGYVKREQNPDDLRQQLVTITDSGREITSLAFRVIKKTNQRLKGLFSDEEADTFNRVLARIVEELEKDNAP